MILSQNKLNMTKMRNLSQLKKDGIELSSTSDEVAKLWDSILFQMYGHFDAMETNGIQGSIESLLAIDPKFPLAHFIAMDYSPDNFVRNLHNLKAELKNQFENQNVVNKWSAYEKTHIKAFVYRLEGHDDLAANCWLDQLVQHPQDLLALQNLNDYYILSGNTHKIDIPFNMCRREMNSQNVFYPFIQGYEAFGLEEKGHLKEAFDLANESLGIYSWNSWAIHTVAHIFDSNYNSRNGIEFMNRTKSEWVDSTVLASHNNWHIALFHIEQDEINEALNIYDKEIIPRLNSQYCHFGMSDAVSLLIRIELGQKHCIKSKPDYDLSERWAQLFTTIGNALQSSSSFNFFDAHLALALMGCKKSKELDKFLDQSNDWLLKFENQIFESWENDIFVENYKNNQQLSNKFITKSRNVIPFIEALKHYLNGDYQATVNILYPIHQELRHIGGSNAQNDLFHQVLASALLNAGGDENLCRLKLLVLYRKETRKYCGYYKNMERMVLDHH